MKSEHSSRLEEQRLRELESRIPRCCFCGSKHLKVFSKKLLEQRQCYECGFIETLDSRGILKMNRKGIVESLHKRWVREEIRDMSVMILCYGIIGILRQFEEWMEKNGFLIKDVNELEDIKDSDRAFRGK